MLHTLGRMLSVKGVRQCTKVPCTFWSSVFRYCSDIVVIAVLSEGCVLSLHQSEVWGRNPLGFNLLLLLLPQNTAIILFMMMMISWLPNSADSSVSWQIWKGEKTSSLMSKNQTAKEDWPYEMNSNMFGLRLEWCYRHHKTDCHAFASSLVNWSKFLIWTLYIRSTVFIISLHNKGCDFHSHLICDRYCVKKMVVNCFSSVTVEPIKLLVMFAVRCSEVKVLSYIWIKIKTSWFGTLPMWVICLSIFILIWTNQNTFDFQVIIQNLFIDYACRYKIW